MTSKMLTVVYIQRNTEERACNHCCSRKAVLHILSVCVLALGIQQAVRMRLIVTFGLSGCIAFFPHFLTNGTIFGKTLPNIKCLFLFSLQLLSETFLILRRTERDITKNIQGVTGGTDQTSGGRSLC